jgi:hypothetical protein
VAEQAPEELQTWPPHEPGPVQAMHCQSPLLQIGVGMLQSELLAQPTQLPYRQMAADGTVQSALDSQATQVPVTSQYGVALSQVLQLPPTGPQCVGSIG